MKQYEQVTKYKKVFKEATVDDKQLNWFKKNLKSAETLVEVLTNIIRKENIDLDKDSTNLDFILETLERFHEEMKRAKLIN